jgi:hypothetical protein
VEPVKGSAMDRLIQRAASSMGDGLCAVQRVRPKGFEPLTS